MKKVLAMLLALAMVATLFVGCGKKEEPAPEQQTEKEEKEPAATEAPAEPVNLTYGITNDWNSLNYFAAAPVAASNIVQEKIFDKLFYICADGSIKARNAESWEFNEDNTVLTIKLNKAAKWHDGEAVTAEDWLFTFQTLCSEEAGFAKATNSKHLAGTDDNGYFTDAEAFGVKALDDYTLELTFKDNMLSLENMLQKTQFGYLTVIPKHILGELTPGEVVTDETFWNAPVGSGPCKFVSHVVNNELVLEANPDYYLGAPKFATLTFKKMDAATSLATFESAGDIDVVFPRYNSDNAIEALTTCEASGFVVDQDAAPTRICYVLINNTNVDDVRIRQAIQLTIDRKALCETVMAGLAVPTATFVTDANPNKKSDIDITPDLEKAAALLKEAGYDTTNRLALTMDTVAGFRATIAAYMQQECAKIGIDITVNTTDVATGFADISSGAVDMAWIVDNTKNTNLYADWYYLANNEGSYTCVTDTSFQEKMDAIKELEKAGDAAALKTAMYEFQDYIYEQAPIIPLFFMYGVNAHSARISNATLEDAVGWNDNCWEWVVE